LLLADRSVSAVRSCENSQFVPIRAYLFRLCPHLSEAPRFLERMVGGLCSHPKMLSAPGRRGSPPGGENQRAGYLPFGNSARAKGEAAQKGSPRVAALGLGLSAGVSTASKKNFHPLHHPTALMQAASTIIQPQACRSHSPRPLRSRSLIDGFMMLPWRTTRENGFLQENDAGAPAVSLGKESKRHDHL